MRPFIWIVRLNLARTINAVKNMMYFCLRISFVSENLAMIVVTILCVVMQVANFVALCLCLSVF